MTVFFLLLITKETVLYIYAMHIKKVITAKLLKKNKKSFIVHVKTAEEINLPENVSFYVIYSILTISQPFLWIFHEKFKYQV